MLKTPALAGAFRPLARLEEQAKEADDETKRGHEAEVEMHKAEKEAVIAEMKKAAKGKGNGERDLKSEFAALEPPKPPIWRRYKTNDSTIEKLGV